MENNQSTASLIENLINQTKDYAEKRIELYKMKVVDKTGFFISAIVLGLIFFVLFFIFFFILSIGLGFLIGSWVNSNAGGFLILAGLYLFAGFLLFILRRKLIRGPITGVLIRKFL